MAECWYLDSLGCCDCMQCDNWLEECPGYEECECIYKEES